MTEDTFYRVSVKGTVFDEQGRFLLAREADGTWELLGGGLGHGEDPVECLKREIQEETGLVAMWISPSPKCFLTAPSVSNPAIYTANVVYEMKLENLEFTPSDECQELQFFTLAEAKRVKRFPNVDTFIGLLGKVL